MKKTAPIQKKLSCLIALGVMLLTPGVQATSLPDLPFDFSEFPFVQPDESEFSAVSEGIEVTLEGQVLTLPFDATPEFSHISNGIVQASFFGYDASGLTMYELYLIFPETVKSQSTFTQQDAIASGLDDCCTAVLITATQREDLYVAGHYNGAAYPSGTSYTLSFESVTDVSGGRQFTGTLTATLSGEDINGNTIPQKITLDHTPFSFTLPNTGSENPSAPQNTPQPTLRPDMFRI